MLDSAGDTLATEFRVLPANALGGFGQYYAGSLYNLGLTRRPEGGFDRVADGFATHLAETVQRTVDATEYIRGRWYERRKVPRDVLQESADRLSIDAIRESFADEERSLLRSMFFATRVEERSLPSWRRSSLMRILRALSAYAEAGVPVEADTLDLQLLYAPAYYGVLCDSKGAVARPYLTPDSVAPCAEQWRQFCAHEYLTWSLETVLSSLLELLGSAGGGLTAGDAAAALIGQGFEETLARCVGKPVGAPWALFHQLGIKGGAGPSTCAAANEIFGLATPLNEQVTMTHSTSSPAEATATAVLALALLYARWRGCEGDAAYEEIRASAPGEIALPTFLPLLDEWLGRGLSWHDAMHALVTFIVRQHDRVMYEKGRLDSCWVDTEGDRLTRAQDYGAALRASRHRQAVRILEDLLVLAGSESDHIELTSIGKAILRDEAARS